MGIKRIACGVALAATVSISAAAPKRGANEREFLTLAVLVNDIAGLRPDLLLRAEHEVERIFWHAGVKINWLKCTEMPEAGGSRPCPPRPTGTIIVRIVPTSLEYIGNAALGYALPGPDGIYATVSLPRVQQCIARQKKSAASFQAVLGHAMAHEIAHILLGVNSHSAAGLMIGDWDSRVLDDLSKGRLYLLPHEAVRVCEAVAQRGRTNPVAARTPLP